MSPGTVAAIPAPVPSAPAAAVVEAVDGSAGAQEAVQSAPSRYSGCAPEDTMGWSRSVGDLIEQARSASSGASASMVV